MRIIFSPQRSDAHLELSRAGDTITVNGRSFDFSSLPEGATLPQAAIDSVWFCGPVERIDGVLHVHLLLPIGPSPSAAAAFPDPITLTTDGPVELPQ